MGRTISPDRIETIMQARQNDPEAVGPILGELATSGKVPVECLAKMLVVSEPTIYRWMYGISIPRGVYLESIGKILTILRKAKRAKDLPLEGTQAERVAAFIEVVKTHRTRIPNT